MIKSLRESKATLSALVEQASQGEEIIITVHGKPKARLCPVEKIPTADEKAAWISGIKENWGTYTVKVTDSSTEIMDELREDRF